MFIKAVSDTVFHMIKAVYHDKPLIFIGAMFWEHHMVKNNTRKIPVPSLLMKG